jgi:hypothetical protein
VDWEDITRADGKLYIAETGNNGNGRRDLGVYVLTEPNPTAVDRARAMRFLPVRYPDQEGHPGDRWHFDCEAVFVADGKLHFLTKHRMRGMILGLEAGTKLYRLDTETTESENVLTLVGRRPDVFAPTAAEMSPDGNRLAVLTYPALWVFERPEPGGDWLSGKASRIDLDAGKMGTNEGVAWKDDRTIVTASENRRIFEIDLGALVPVD